MGKVTLRRLVPAVIVVLLAVASLFGPPPKGGKTKFFVGLWEGVDILDGSTVQFSISDLDRDGVLELRYREGHFSICFDGVDNTQGRGIYSASAVVNGAGELEIDGALVCINDDDTAEAPVNTLFTGHADHKDDILAVVGDGFTDPLILHRTSSK